MAKHITEISLLDRTNERSPVRIHNGPVTALTIGGFLTQFGAFRDAIDAITLGAIAQEMWIGDLTTLAATPPTDNFAQREIKLLIVYEDVVTHKKYTFTIPTIDLDQVTFTPGGKDAVQVTAGAVQNVIDTFEALGKSPDNDANGVNVLSMRVVGRNI